MRRWLPWIVAAVLGAILVHVVAVRAIPSLVMRAAMSRIGALAGINKPSFAPRADAAARAIVRPSPDLLYSTCVFDVFDQPLHITADVPPGTYWSLSMFADNTDNFFKINDHEAKDRHLDLVVAKAGEPVALPPGAQLVESPSFQGIVLTRTLVDDDARLAELDEARRSFHCAPLDQNGTQ